jgi:hypothetical protein
MSSLSLDVAKRIALNSFCSLLHKTRHVMNVLPVSTYLLYTLVDSEAGGRERSPSQPDVQMTLW